MLAILTLVAGLITLATGSWRFDVLGLRISMSSSSRAFAIALTFAIGCAAFTRRARQALASRPALTFYAGATLMTMVLAHGPVMAYRSVVILDPACGWLERAWNQRAARAESILDGRVDAWGGGCRVRPARSRQRAGE